MQGSTVMHQSRAGTLAPEEPDELIAHVRVCGGAGWVTTGSTRKPTPHSFRSYLAPAIGRGSLPALGSEGARRRQTKHSRATRALFSASTAFLQAKALIARQTAIE